MDAVTVAGVVLGCTSGGIVAGMLVRGLLPESHLSGDSRDSIKAAMGLVTTMTALVLGLLVASATGVYDSHRTGVQQLATNVLLLDRVLAQFGPDSAAARAELRGAVEALLDRLWTEQGYLASDLDFASVAAGATPLYAAIRDLPVTDDGRRTLRAQAQQTLTELTRTRWSLAQQANSSIPRPFLAVLVFWLTMLFLSFGLFAPRNATVVLAFLIAALSVTGALFLIAEMDQPFRGLIQVTATPLRDALLKLGQ